MRTLLGATLAVGLVVAPLFGQEAPKKGAPPAGTNKGDEKSGPGEGSQPPPKRRRVDHEIRPDAIGDRTREIRVVARGQPACKGQAAVGGVAGRKRFAVKRTRRADLAGARLNDVAGRGDENRGPPFPVTGFATDASDEIEEAVIVVVGPFLQRMVVASATVERHGSEQTDH